LALLQKTKLRPEAEVVFPDKSILYRREEKVRVISMTWFRVAVAAAIILIAGFATFRLINTNGEIPTVAEINKPKNQPSDKTIEQPISNPNEQIAKDAKDVFVNAGKKLTKEQPNEKKNDKRTIDETVVPKTSIAKRENKNNLPEERKNNQQIIDPNETIAIASLPDRERNDAIVEKNQTDAINTDFDKSDVTLKVSPTLYIPEQEEREKGGIKEFLRKTTRVFERRTRIQTTTDDNKLLLGAFAVSLK